MTRAELNETIIEIVMRDGTISTATANKAGIGSPIVTQLGGMRNLKDFLLIPQTGGGRYGHLHKKPGGTKKPTTMRNCLKCRCAFASEGPHNRLCKECAYENQSISSMHEGGYAYDYQDSIFDIDVHRSAGLVHRATLPYGCHQSVDKRR